MSTLDDLKAELATLRDEAKVQAHLGSMEAQQAWQESEAKWNRFVAEAGLQETGQNIQSALEMLADELRVSYERLKKAL